VLVNLATNARDAMPKGGIITIFAASESTTEDQHPEKLEPGNYVRLTITDTGTGMDAATLARVMEPFFTTKEQGKGTGLGLPMARGFAQQSGGTIAIASEVGHGTTVTMWLPVTNAASIQPGHLAKFAGTRRAEEWRLLIVDDEVLIRDVLAEELSDRGYEVIQAGSGERALALLAAGQDVDLIISDLSMPDMDGVSLIRAVQALKPRLPAILLTGYVGDAASLAVGGALNGSFSLLRKPVTGVHLADRVAALLEATTVMME
jgi:CheY-like chemotaxis protein/anti-sigma regulatory factor (Ser/Thr protein kinase)